MAKLFSRITWLDEILGAAERYLISDNAGTPIHSNAQIVLSTSVAQAGTPVDASTMNRIEAGIDAIDDAVSSMRNPATELTINSDAITVTQSLHKLQPQTGNTDNLSTINGTVAGQTGVLYLTDGGTDTITVIHGSGNIRCIGGMSFTFSLGALFWYSDGTYVHVASQIVRETAYKIAVSINGSNGLVVSLQHIDGASPSVGRPLWLPIGNTWRALTVSPSVTLAAATNWMNLGGSVEATKEHDVFVYASWRSASSEVVAGLSRIPYAAVYSDFNATSTNERHGEFSTAPGATDDCVVIGRIAVTLSVGSGYTWTSSSASAPTSANTKNYHITESRWMSLGAPSFVVSTIDNGSGGQPPINEYRYRISGRKIDAHISGNGVKAGAGAYFTFAAADLPLQPINLTGANPVGSAYLADGVIPGTAVYFAPTNLHCIFSASIADNTAFTNGWGANFGYEA